MLPFYFSKIHFNIILPCKPESVKWSASNYSRFTPMNSLSRKLSPSQGKSRYFENWSLLHLQGIETRIIQPVVRSLYRLSYRGFLINCYYCTFSIRHLPLFHCLLQLASAVWHDTAWRHNQKNRNINSHCRYLRKYLPAIPGILLCSLGVSTTDWEPGSFTAVNVKSYLAGGCIRIM